MKNIVSDLVAVCRAFGLFERDVICCGTVTVSQCTLLSELSDGAREIGALAATMGLTNSGMTRLVDGLEERGWVERVRGVEDRRRVEVRLTTAGQNEAKRLEGLTEACIGGVLGRIPSGKRAQVVESLRLVREAIDSAREQLACCAPREA
ncbi:MAG: MarR family winged helix-turn-helix transcriptional regulator [Polyangiaceae bacterium]